MLYNSRASKKLSYLLRHCQDPLYISLDGGWAKVDAILDTLQISQTQLEQIVAEDEKMRSGKSCSFPDEGNVSDAPHRGQSLRFHRWNFL